MGHTAIRSDARRNVERLLEAALRVLGKDPGASIEEVAAASGIHRSTVYRRFPTRDALVQALVARALSEVSELVNVAAEGTPDEAKLQRLCLGVVSIGERYAFLQTHVQLSELGPDPIGVRKLMRRYQRAGVIRTDMPAAWLASAFTAIGVALFDDIHLPAMTPEDAARVFAQTFLTGARAQS